MDNTTDRAHECRTDEIERLRLHRGLSLDKLARDARIHIRTLKRLLRGNRAYLHTIARIAEALGTRCDNLLLHPPGLAPLASDEHTLSEFALAISLIGRCDSSSDVTHLTRIAPAIAEELRQKGVSLASYESTLQVSTPLSAESPETIVLLYGRKENGSPMWVFVALHPSKIALFLKGQPEQHIDLFNFTSLGRIVYYGYELYPPDDTVAFVTNLTGVDCRPLADVLRHITSTEAFIRSLPSELLSAPIDRFLITGVRAICDATPD